LSDVIIRIDPTLIRHRLSVRAKRSSDIEPWNGLRSGDWDRTCRVRLDQTVKHKSVFQRYAEGLPWEETDIFKNQYSRGFRKSKQLRDCISLEQLAKLYYDRVDGLFASMEKHGFLSHVDGRQVDIPYGHIASDGEPMLGNEGNHRVAMAKVLGLDHVLLAIRSIHPDAPVLRAEFSDRSATYWSGAP